MINQKEEIKLKVIKAEAMLSLKSLSVQFLEYLKLSRKNIALFSLEN